MVPGMEVAGIDVQMANKHIKKLSRRCRLQRLQVRQIAQWPEQLRSNRSGTAGAGKDAQQLQLLGAWIEQSMWRGLCRYPLDTVVQHFPSGVRTQLSPHPCSPQDAAWSCHPQSAPDWSRPGPHRCRLMEGA